MNIFAGTGKIIDVNLNSKVLKFNLASEQGKPCLIPCVLFDVVAEDNFKSNDHFFYSCGGIKTNSWLVL